MGEYIKETIKDCASFEKVNAYYERLAINESMLFAVEVEVDRSVVWGDNIMEEDDDLAILTRVTEKMCGFGSEIAIGYLKKYYNEFFTGYCEVEGHNAQYFPDGKISPHAIAIAKGLSGRYYGFSPANFGVAPTNRLIDFYEANSVSKLMEIVKKQEGGEWPELNRVSDVVENPRTKDDGYLPLVEFGEDNTDPYFSGRFLRVLDEYIIERGMTQSNNLIKRMVGALDLMKLYKK